MQKCTDHKTLVRILSEMGFSLIRHGKHAIYSNGKITLAVPGDKKGFSRMVARRLLKEAGRV